MKKFLNKRVFLSFLTFVSAVILTALVIFFAQGYHFSPKTGKIEKTGLLVLTSTPNGASIFINDHLTDATNTTLKLVPATYEVRIEKEGCLPWKKKLEVVEGLVTAADATLFPALPTLRPLTFFGVKNPVLSPDGTKIAFLSDAPEKAGVWLLNLSTQPLTLKKSELYQIAKDSPWQRFSSGTLSWSPEGKNILVSFEKPETVFLLEPNTVAEKQKPIDITPTLKLYQTTWEEEKRKKDEVLLALLPDYLKQIATTSALTRWSPDEEKLLYQEEGEVKVYDLKWEGEDKTETEGKVHALPEALDYLWLPEAKNNHVILTQEGQISIIEADGTNKATIFGGEIEENFVAPWTDGSRLVILTSLNKPAGTPPNLYTINLR